MATAISSAGKRYNTVVNLEIESILSNLHAVNRDDEYTNGILRLTYKLKRELPFRGAEHPDIKDEIDKLNSNTTTIINRLLGLKNKTKYENIAWNVLQKRLDDTTKSASDIYWFLKGLQDEERKGNPYASTTIDTGNAWTLYQALDNLNSYLDDTRTQLFSMPRMILRGEAGIGKTHLLCDYAKNRLESDRPTLIFLAHELIDTTTGTDPVARMAALLNYKNSKTFLGKLEQLTKDSPKRVCLIIDAVNEADQIKWAQLAPLFNIKGLSIVISVRNGYDKLIKNANKYTIVEHFGFAEMEWAAISTFFRHYKMKLPEIPVIDPEFKNPLFLMIFCEAYAGKKDKTPRGKGATHVFEQYVETQSIKILDELGLNLPKDYLWRRVIKEVGVWMGVNRKPRILRPQLLKIINKDTNLSPHSSRLVALMEHHGLLLKYPSYTTGGKRNGYRYTFTYNRFSDHLIVRSLLTENRINSKERAEDFFGDGSFLEKNIYNTGLMEALSIQIPERCNKTEFVWAMPERYRDDWSIKTAFLGGVKWRDVEFDGVDKKTGELKYIDEDQVLSYMNTYLVRSEHDFFETLDCLLDVCAIPLHPFNANRLHKILNRYTLPNRDAWWQRFMLYRTYESGNAIDRLQSWSLSELTEHASEESVELASVVLIWTLASTDRKLRNRSTRSLVALYKNHQGSLFAALNRFKENNDPYITERLFAVAYGALSLNPNDKENFKSIVLWLYANHFLDKKRMPDALKDDFAKGIIELYLRHYPNHVRIKTRNIIPPFKYYKFPKKIPTTKWLRNKYKEDGDNNYYSVWGSLMYGEGHSLADFGNYTMGSVLGELSSIPLSTKPPKDTRDEYDKFRESLGKRQRELLDAYNMLSFRPILSFIRSRDEEDVVDTENGSDESTAQALNAFEKSLGPLKRLKYRKFKPYIVRDISPKRENYDYNLNIARRWIFNRVIKLGWNPKQHQEYDRARGSFDRHQSSSAERIGKKYQWIGLSEFLALAGSNYYFKADRWSSRAKFIRYQGAYQTSLRDIDPTLDPLWLQTKNDEDDDSQDVWWSPKYDGWGLKNWKNSTKDIPSPTKHIQVTENNTEYLNLLSWRTWKGPSATPEDEDNHSYPELFMHVNGYIVRKKDLPTIKEWCASKEFYNRTLPEPHDESGAIFLKEMTNSAAYREVAAPYQTNWVKKSSEIPFDVLSPIEGYSGGSFETDDTSKSVRIYAPSGPLQEMLKLRPSEKIGEYISKSGKITMFDPSVDYSGVYSSLIVNKDYFLKELEKKGLTVIWTVLGEKLYIGGIYNDEYRGQRLEVHGYCYFDENGKLVENIRFKDEWKETKGEEPANL